jgi:hypothetical protein
MEGPTTQISTEYIMTLHAPLEAPQNVSSDLQIYNAMLGGWVGGPAIRGQIISPSGDWLPVMPNGTRKLDDRVSILADDGSVILMTYTGRITTAKNSAKKLQPGSVLKADDQYFITTPTFETNSKTYGWLTDIVAVGKMVSSKDGENGHVTYEIFAVR